MNKLRNSKTVPAEKKTLTLLRHADELYVFMISVLNNIAFYEPNHKNPPFSVDDGKHVTTNMINLMRRIEDSEYCNNARKPIIWLRRIIKALGVEYVKDSYKEGIK